jgi:hypothetical protein
MKKDLVLIFSAKVLLGISGCVFVFAVNVGTKEILNISLLSQNWPKNNDASVETSYHCTVFDIQ